jgi:GT2 family glycosyltransferase
MEIGHFSLTIIENDIIVINNNSTDNTKNILDSNYKNIQSIHLNENIASAGGFSKGMQTAFEKGYDWVWLFNDDSRPVEGSLKSILTHLNSDKIQIGLLKIANKDENNKAVLLYWNGVRKPVYVDVSNEIVQTDLITFDGCIISKKTINLSQFKSHFQLEVSKSQLEREIKTKTLLGIYKIAKSELFRFIK